MQDQAELVTDIVEREVVLREHMLSDAYRAATDLIDKFLDHGAQGDQPAKLPFGARERSARSRRRRVLTLL